DVKRLPVSAFIRSLPALDQSCVISRYGRHGLGDVTCPRGVTSDAELSDDVVSDLPREGGVLTVVPQESRLVCDLDEPRACRRSLPEVDAGALDGEVGGVVAHLVDDGASGGVATRLRCEVIGLGGRTPILERDPVRGGVCRPGQVDDLSVG